MLKIYVLEKYMMIKINETYELRRVWISLQCLHLQSFDHILWILELDRANCAQAQNFQLGGHKILEFELNKPN